MVQVFNVSKYNTKGQKSCPECGTFKEIFSGFGTRIANGNVIPQSWCKSCR